MATFTNTSKSSNATFTNTQHSGSVFYITTDAPDYVLVGASSNEYLVWQDLISWTNTTKN